MTNPLSLLSGLDQVAVEEFPWGKLQWLCNARLMPGAAQTFGICTIQPGQGNPLHYHPNCEEILYVAQGRCRHSIEGQWLDMAQGSMIRVPTGVKHNLINTGDEPLVCIISFSSADRQTVFLE